MTLTLHYCLLEYETTISSLLIKGVTYFKYLIREVASFVTIFHIDKVFIGSFRVVVQFDYILMSHLGVNRAFLLSVLVSKRVKESILLYDLLDHILNKRINIGKKKLKIEDLLIQN